MNSRLLLFAILLTSLLTGLVEANTYTFYPDKAFFQNTTLHGYRMLLAYNNFTAFAVVQTDDNKIIDVFFDPQQRNRNLTDAVVWSMQVKVAGNWEDLPVRNLRFSVRNNEPRGIWISRNYSYSEASFMNSTYVLNAGSPLKQNFKFCPALNREYALQFKWRNPPQMRWNETMREMVFEFLSKQYGFWADTIPYDLEFDRNDNFLTVLIKFGRPRFQGDCFIIDPTITSLPYTIGTANDAYNVSGNLSITFSSGLIQTTSLPALDDVFASSTACSFFGACVYHIFAKFNSSAIPSGASINNVVLYLTKVGHGANFVSANVSANNISTYGNGSAVDWSEASSASTLQNLPYNATGNFTLVNTINTTYAWNVTNSFRAAYTNAHNYTLRMNVTGTVVTVVVNSNHLQTGDFNSASGAPNNTIQFNSSEANAGTPMLNVTYTLGGAANAPAIVFNASANFSNLTTDRPLFNITASITGLASSVGAIQFDAGSLGGNRLNNVLFYLQGYSWCNYMATNNANFTFNNVVFNGSLNVGGFTLLPAQTCFNSAGTNQTTYINNSLINITTRHATIGGSFYQAHSGDTFRLFLSNTAVDWVQPSLVVADFNLISFGQFIGGTYATNSSLFIENSSVKTETAATTIIINLPMLVDRQTVIQNTVFNHTPTGDDVGVTFMQVNGSTHNITNSTYDFDVFSFLGGSGENATVNRKWWTDVRVVSNTGANLSGVQVEIYEENGHLAFSGTTDSNGRVERQALIQYYHLNSSTKNFISFDNFSASLIGVQNSTTRNVTGNLLGASEVVIVLQATPLVCTLSPRDAETQTLLFADSIDDDGFIFYKDFYLWAIALFGIGLIGVLIGLSLKKENNNT